MYAILVYIIHVQTMYAILVYIIHVQTMYAIPVYIIHVQTMYAILILFMYKPCIYAILVLFMYKPCMQYRYYSCTNQVCNTGIHAMLQHSNTDLCILYVMHWLNINILLINTTFTRYNIHVFMLVCIASNEISTSAMLSILGKREQSHWS